MFEAEEESDVEVSDELSRLLEQDEKIIQPFEEKIELVNLGSEDDVKEVKIESRLCPDANKGLIDLLREYSDVFAIKGSSILVDHLAHQPIEDYQSVQYDFPDEEILYLKMKDCDETLLEEGPELGSRWGMVFARAVNQYGNGIGAVIITPQGTHLPFTARLTFKSKENGRQINPV
ncbi:hypothetical protein KIW84_030818 [Lathyrus oleraceus]|uniref:Uncharacterized protein n=1 Tax=Pisum sativum TaxID=3888 RepID=A0A9D4XTQ7_PEA|nr:hypothetical protein KIW84_030818 [Pisum sativum]